MNERWKYLVMAIGVIVVSSIATLAVIGYNRYTALEERALFAEAQLVTTEQELLGYSKYTDYIVKLKQSLQGDTKLQTATLHQDAKWVEHIDRKVLGVKTAATVVLDLSIDYTFGFDLRPDKYDIMATTSGLEIRLAKPVSTAKPSVKVLSWEVAEHSLFIDEKKAGLELMTRLQPVFDSEAKVFAKSEAVKAQCEKRLVEHVTAFLGKQPGVRLVPRIVVVYR